MNDNSLMTFWHNLYYGQLLSLIVYHFDIKFYIKDCMKTISIPNYLEDFTTMCSSSTSALMIAPSGALPCKIRSDIGSSINR